MKKSRIIQGLMRLNDLSVEDLTSLIEFDLANGINFFDISDIYNDGEAEIKLGEVIKANPHLREKMIIQSKCGIVKRRNEDAAYYDLSKEHIIASCLASLKRMNIEYLDYYLLHRPDIFLDNKEVKEAITYLFKNGYIKHFGVSNFNNSLMDYLKKEDIMIEVNQLQLGLGHLNMLSSIFNFNTDFKEATYDISNLFFYLKMNNIDLQCWSPFQYGMFEGLIFNNEKYKALNEYLSILKDKYQVNKTAIAVAFLLMLGENVYLINGSTNKEHIKEALDGLKIRLLKEEWYNLYRKAGAMLP